MKRPGPRFQFELVFYDTGRLEAYDGREDYGEDRWVMTVTPQRADIRQKIGYQLLHRRKPIRPLLLAEMFVIVFAPLMAHRGVKVARLRLGETETADSGFGLTVGLSGLQSLGKHRPATLPETELGNPAVHY